MPNGGYIRKYKEERPVVAICYDFDKTLFQLTNIVVRSTLMIFIMHDSLSPFLGISPNDGQ